MKATDIPFVSHIGIEEAKNSTLSLDVNDKVLNHIQSIHASAQFALAETQSGVHLQRLFPHLEGTVLPLLRDAAIKYKKPAIAKIVAEASTDEKAVEKFKAQFERKGRGTLQVDVIVTDIHGVVTSEATFTWFVQALNER